MAISKAAELFERASLGLDRGEGEAACGLIDQGLDLDPNSERGRQLLEHVLRRAGRFEELLERLVRIAQRADRGSRASALKDAARLAAGPLSDPARALELYRESLRVIDDDAVLVEAVSRGIRHGFFDVSSRLLPAIEPGLRAERFARVAARAIERGDARAALECRAAAFADTPTREGLDALDSILTERADEEARAEALARYANRTTPPEVAFTTPYQDGESGEAARTAVIPRSHGGERASTEAILEQSRRVSTACADQAILTRGLTAMGDQEHRTDQEEVATHGWDEDILAGNTSDQVHQIADAVGALVDERARGSLLSRRIDPIEPNVPPLEDTVGDGVPLGPAEAVQLHLSAGDVESLVERIQDAVDREEEIDRATWLRAGRFLGAIGRAVEARQCLLHAIGERTVWDRAAARALAAQGDHREAARALAATEAPTEAEDLAWIGERYLADGDDAEATRWFERAQSAEPSNAVVAARLLELSSRAHKDERVEALLSAHASFVSPVWHLAVARAQRRKGRAPEAKEAVERALATDASLLEPAMLLFDLGREQAEDGWIDRALAEIRIRALERGERSRAFVAAGLLVARGAASEDDRLTYEALRIDLSSAPRATLPAGWADGWLIQVEGSAAEVTFDEKRSRAVDLEPGLLDALEAAEGVCGVADVRVVALWGEGPPAAVWDDPARIGFQQQELVRWLPKAFRFEVGRALAALTEPRLRGGLVDAQLTAEGTVVLLDRAGLLVAQDPVQVLESIGVKTPRGRALTAFAVSDELFGLWARIGLGVDTAEHHRCQTAAERLERARTRVFGSSHRHRRREHEVSGPRGREAARGAGAGPRGAGDRRAAGRVRLRRACGPRGSGLLRERARGFPRHARAVRPRGRSGGRDRRSGGSVVEHDPGTRHRHRGRDDQARGLRGPEGAAGAADR